jgi:hypothetical protein
MIKTKIESENITKTKLSAFSLIDTKNKIRYTDYKGYTEDSLVFKLIPFRKEKIIQRKWK